jgi:hypothetical protein
MCRTSALDAGIAARYCSVCTRSPAERTPTVTKPNLTNTRFYSDERLAEYHLFAIRMSQSGGNTRSERNGRMAWLRETARVQRELDRRMA